MSADFQKATYGRGRDDNLTSSIMGYCRLTLKDTTGKYIPENTAADLYPYVIPGRPVRLWAVHPVGTIIEDCEDAWTSADGANITAGTNTGKVGTNCAKFTVGAGFAGSGLVGYENISSLDLSGQSHIAFWIKTDRAWTKGELELVLDDTNGCVSTLENLDVPTLVADTWTQVVVEMNDPSLLGAVLSVGINMTIANPEANVIEIDDVRPIFPLFEGFIDNVLPYLYGASKYVAISCFDGLDSQAKTVISTKVMAGTYSGEQSGADTGAINEALNEADWPSDKRAIDDGIASYPVIYANDVTCLEFAQNVEQSEYGMYYINGVGDQVYEDRHHRLQPSHLTSLWTCDNTMHEQVVPLYSMNSVANHIVLKSNWGTIAVSLGVIWTCPENKDHLGTDGNADPNSILIEAGATKNLWVEFTDTNGQPNIAAGVTTPVATTDYLGNDNQDGTGTNRTNDLAVTTLTEGTNLWSNTANITVANNGATSLYLTFMQLRGKIYTDLGMMKAVSEDATSITAYRRRDAEARIPYWQSYGSLDALADYVLSIKKNPIPGHLVHLNGSRNATVLGHLLQHKVSDRITVQDSTYNINDEFFINKIEHEIDLKIHKCTWTVSRADDYEYWVLGTSALGTGSRLAY